MTARVRLAFPLPYCGKWVYLFLYSSSTFEKKPLSCVAAGASFSFSFFRQVSTTGQFGLKNNKTTSTHCLLSNFQLRFLKSSVIKFHYLNFCTKTMSATPVNQQSMDASSPLKRKIASPAASPSKKSMAMEIENIPSGEILKEITGNQLISTGSEKKEAMEVETCPRLLFKKTTENAYEPTKGSKLAAGFDLKSAYEYTVPKRGSCLVKTDIQIQLPSGTYGRVAPRSGLALKNQIDVGAGVIDEDYRGDVGVILFNHGDNDFKVAKGDRIAQLICEKICYPEVVEVELLDDSDRGSGGFGSTGVKSE